MNQDLKFILLSNLIMIVTVSVFIVPMYYLWIVPFSAEHVEYNSKPFDCDLIKDDPEKYFPNHDTLEKKHNACTYYNEEYRFQLIDHFKNTPTQFLQIIGIFGFIILLMMSAQFLPSRKKKDEEKYTPPCNDVFDTRGNISKTECCKDE